MKILFRILILFVFAAVVCGAFSLVVNHTPAISAGKEAQGRPSSSFGGNTGNHPAGGHADEDGGSAAGFSGLGTTLIKFGLVTALVFVIQQGLSWLGRFKKITAHPSR